MRIFCRYKCTSLANIVVFMPCKGKTIPFQACTGLQASRSSRVPEFLDSRFMKVVRFSNLSSGRLFSQGDIPGTHFCWRLSRLEGHGVAGRIKTMKNSSITIGNRAHDLRDLGTVPQPTAPPHTPLYAM
jgi:hypothetical protein